MDIWLIILLMVVCLLLEGFFSGSEIGVVSANRLKLRHLAAKGSRGAQIAVEMLRKPEWLLSTTLVGTNIAIVTNTSLATLLAVKLFGKEYAWVAILIVAPLIWVFGEIVPKSIFQQKADVLTPKVIFILKGASLLFFPILIIFTSLTRLLTRLVSGRSKGEVNSLKDEIDLMLQLPSVEGDVHAIEKSMIRRMFDFGETRARDISTPLIDVLSVARTATCGSVVKLAGARGHALIPVHSGRVDEIIGQINALHLMGEDENTPSKEFIRPVRYVPPSKKVDELLLDFRKDGDTMAVMVGEFGGARGIITLEDILEQVVGSMEDEYDRPEKQRDWVKPLGKGQFLVGAHIDLSALTETTGVALPDGNYETLAGYLLERLEEIPVAGQQVEFGKTQFTIERVTERTIREVRISR